MKLEDEGFRVVINANLVIEQHGLTFRAWHHTLRATTIFPNLTMDDPRGRVLTAYRRIET